MNDITTKKDIEQFRTPSEYISWFNFLLQNTRYLNQTYEYEYTLLHKGLYKDFYEEIFPMAKLLQLKIYDWAHCRFKNVIGSQPYDVEILGHKTLSYMEISCTTFHDGEYFKMTSFLSDDIVNITGNIIRNNHNKTIGIENVARDNNDYVLEQVKLINSRITMKLTKDYPDKTALLILYDDESMIFNAEDYSKIRSICESLQRSWKKSFVSLFAIGINGKKLIEL